MASSAAVALGGRLRTTNRLIQVARWSACGSVLRSPPAIGAGPAPGLAPGPGAAQRWSSSSSASSSANPASKKPAQPAAAAPAEPGAAGAAPAEDVKMSPAHLIANFGATARRLSQFVIPAKAEIAKGLVCLPFGLVSSIALPSMAGRFVDQLGSIVSNAAGDISAVYPTMGLIGLIAVVGTIGSGLRSYYFNLAGEIIAKHIRLRLFSSLLKKRTPFFDRHRTGDLMSRLAADTNIVSSVLTESVSMAIRSLGILVIGSGVLLYTSPKLALATIGVILPFAIISRLYGRFIRAYTTKQLRKQGDAASVAEEVLNNMRTVGVFSREAFEAQRYATEVQEAFVHGRKIAQRRGIFMGSVNMVMACSVMGVLGVGAFDSVQPVPTISAGQYATFLMLSGHVGGALHSLSTVYSSLMRAVGASERILEILEDQQPEESYAAPYSDWRVLEDSAVVQLDPRRSVAEFAPDLPMVRRATQEALELPEDQRALYFEKQRLLQLQLLELLRGVAPSLEELENHPPAAATEAADGLAVAGSSPLPEGQVYGSNEAYLQALLSGHAPLDQALWVRQAGGQLQQVFAPGDPPPALHFRDIEFAYPTRAQAPVFRGLDLRIPIGSVCAILGPSGSGKSTLLSLLARFYEPDRGAVEIAGLPLDQLDLRWLRSVVSAVPQETVLFRGSIADNIRYGNLGVTQAQIEDAARQANAHHFITAFPQGYDTPANQLSGGQRQRICCARAIVRNPPILVLDEATSALDVESEWAVQQALENLMRGRTTLVIAHRLSTIRNAQYIAILDEGRVVEFGTRDEVMGLKNGRFNEYLQKSTSWSNQELPEAAASQ